jgi:hypothetical protein
MASGRELTAAMRSAIGNVFAKLGIRSRIELSQLINSAEVLAR